MKITKVYSAGIFAAAALFASGCFNPDLTGVVFKCDDINNTQCPAGQTCLEGDCVPAESPSPTDPGLDGGTGGVDMASPGGTTTGCSAGGGSDVSKGSSKQAYACTGVFGGYNRPNASSLCASGYQLCTNADTIDLTKCNQEPKGFFVSKVLTKRDRNTPPGTGCGSPGKNETAMFAGCGPGTTSVVTLTSACSNFAKAWDCNDNQLACYNLGGYSPDASQSTRTDYGVLCCKK